MKMSERNFLLGVLVSLGFPVTLLAADSTMGPAKLTAKQIANYIINKKIDPDGLLPAKLIEEILSTEKKDEIDISELTFVVKKVLKENPKIAEDYKKGKNSVVQFAIGQVMYILRKKIDTEILRKLIMEELK